MKLNNSRNRELPVDEENPYWMSFSDIMSGLLVIFILAALSLILELTQTRTTVDNAIQEIKKAEKIRQLILSEVVEELRQKNITVEISDNDTVLRIPDQLLTFSPNQYMIPTDKNTRNTLTEIGSILFKTIEKNDRWQYLDTIFIEGHTDKRKSYRKMGNWGLSTYRAIAVWDYWGKQLPRSRQLSALKNHDDKLLFSVSGYGKTRPETINQLTEDDFKRNRRIDIRFTVKRPSLKDLEDISDIL